MINSLLSSEYGPGPYRNTNVPTRSALLWEPLQGRFSISENFEGNLRDSVTSAEKVQYSKKL